MLTSPSARPLNRPHEITRELRANHARPRPGAKKDPLPGRVEGSNPYLIDPADYNRQFPKKTLKEFDKGVEADHQGKTDEAIEHYEKALSFSPNYYPAHNNLGSAI